MWISPNHPDRERLMRPEAPTSAPVAPAESGQRLATLTRPNRDKPDEELRITLDEFNGHPFVGLRVWTKDDRSGEWWPTKKGVTIRARELDSTIKVLRVAMRTIEALANVTSSRPNLPEVPRAGGGDFDEFDPGG